MRKLLLGCLFTLSALSGYQAKAVVWENQNEWSQDWEDKYTNWVETSWDDEVFMRKDSVVYNVPTDCADASYTMRALFAYLNKLPFQVLNPSTKDFKGKYVSNQSTQFDRIADSDERFRVFIKTLNEYTDSGTLANDTYPVSLERRFFRAGAVYVEPNDHSYQVKSVSKTGVPILYSSTVPKQVRYLSILNSFPYYMPTDFKNHRDGFRLFKQPKHYEMSSLDLPGYGLQQFAISQKHGDDILSFGDEMASVMSIVPESMSEKINRAAINMCYFSMDRGVTVGWTLTRKSASNNRCFTAAEYDSESTPSRDRKLKMLYDYAEKLTHDAEFKSAEAMYKPAIEFIFDGRPAQGADPILKWCDMGNPYVWLNDFSLKHVWQAIQSGTLVSDPNATLKQRWGLESYTPTCPTY